MPDPEQTRLLEEVAARMRPGGYSQAGFLGAEENLADLLAADARTLVELAISPAALAEGVQRLIEPILTAGLTRGSAGRYLIRLKRYKGSQICPFGDRLVERQCRSPGSARLSSIDWAIFNARTLQRLSGPGLIVHLIGTHGFFNGVATPHRVDPRALARLLELGPFAPQ